MTTCKLYKYFTAIETQVVHVKTYQMSLSLSQVEVFLWPYCACVCGGGEAVQPEKTLLYNLMTTNHLTYRRLESYLGSIGERPEL